MVVRKGYNVEVDSYSAFFENDGSSDTGLDEYLKAEKVTRVVVVGLAYDFCVKYTALDAKKLGYDVYVIRDCCRGVNMPGTMDSAEKELAAAGVRVVESLADVSSSF
jgi:nicotinamidase/pyrazinamidase